jgi:TetR/AcrR family transcriptional repressor of nem operon
MARTKDFDESELLVKAMNLFWYKGYNGTSMQDLVDGLGISRSSLYDTYGDKHALYVKALENYKASASIEMCRMVSEAASAKEAIKQLLDLTTRSLLSDDQHKGCFMVNAAVEVGPHDAEVGNVVCENDKLVEEAFYNAILKGQRNGEISADKDAMAISRFIFNNVKGMRVAAKSTTDRSFFDGIVKLTLSVLD